MQWLLPHNLCYFHSVQPLSVNCTDPILAIAGVSGCILDIHLFSQCMNRWDAWHEVARQWGDLVWLACWQASSVSLFPLLGKSHFNMHVVS